MGNDSNNIWMSEDPRYSRAGVGYPDYLSPADKGRLERIRQGRMLFDGRHRELFLAEARTQFSFREVRKFGGGVCPLYVTTNILRLVAMKAADLLFGEVPLLASDNPEQHAEMQDIADRSGLHQVVYQAAVDGSVEAEAFLEGIIYDNEVYIQQVPGEEISPVGPLMPDGQYSSFIRRTVETIAAEGGGNTGKTLLLERTYRAGSIEQSCWDVSGGKKVAASLADWPAFKDAGEDTRAPIVYTGIEWNTITWVPNLMVRRRPVSDFDGVVELQDTLNAKASQLSVVILKHAQPRLLVPDQLIEEGGTLADAEVLVSRPGDADAKYLTWDAQLDAAMKDRAFVLQQILVQTETSPVLLGLKEGAAPDAYRKVRLEAFNSLTKAARRAVYWTEGLRTALTSALMLDGTLAGKRYEESEISVQLRDGIPQDSLDEANRLATLITAGVVDEQWCLEQLLPDPAGVADVLARVQAKRMAATPSVFMQNEQGNADQNVATDGTTSGAETGGVARPTKDMSFNAASAAE